MPRGMPISPSNNQTPAMPPTAKLASNQRIQIARLFMDDSARVVAAQTRAKGFVKVRAAELAATSDTTARSKGGKVHCDKSHNLQKRRFEWPNQVGPLH